MLSDDGRLVGSMVLPAAFRMTAIGTSEVVGVWRDDLDVETVRAYRYVRR